MDTNDNEQKATLQNLILFSSQLTRAIQDRRKLERLLTQLTFFKNFLELIRNDSESEAQCLHSLFSLESKLLPDSGGESCILTVVNCCPKFSFDSEYWSFNVVHCGRVVSGVTTWAFNQPTFGPNTKENISIKLGPLLGNDNYEPVKLKVNLIFCISTQDRRFERGLNIGETWVDVLYLLSPIPIESGPCGSELSPFAHNYALQTEQEFHSVPPLPPIVQFQIKANPLLRTQFLRRVLLIHSLHRGFSSGSWDSCIKELVFFVRSQRVIINLDSVDNIIQVKCFNLQLLFALKFSLLQRLLGQLEGSLRISSTVNDKNCNALANLKLQLQAMEECSSSSLAPLYENYVTLRKLTESLQFSMENENDEVLNPEPIPTELKNRDTGSSGTGALTKPSSEIITLDSENEDEGNPGVDFNMDVQIGAEQVEKAAESESTFMEDAADSYSDDDI